MAALGSNGTSYRKTRGFKARRTARRLPRKRISAMMCGAATPTATDDVWVPLRLRLDHVAFKHQENGTFSSPEATSKSLALTALTLELVLIPAIIGVIRSGGQATRGNERLVICLSRQRKIIGKHSCYGGTYRHAYQVASPGTLGNLLF